MRRPHRNRVLVATLAAGMLLAPVLSVAGAAAQEEGVDTNDDGVPDDFDGDGVADDLDGDCIPDDFNGDGVPDADITFDGCTDGEGGTLPESLSIQTVAGLLDPLFVLVPDTTEPGEEPDGFPNIPRLEDDAGNDIGPDWSILDNLLGEPGERDLLQLADDGLNQEMLEFEDINNQEFIDPVTGEIELVATPTALAYTLGQVSEARGDLGLIAGSGSTLRGPCMGMAWSFDEDGRPLDVAWDFDQDGPPIGFRDVILPGEIAVEQVFTSSRPFRVHVDGAVIYTGIAGGLPPGTGPIEHDWFIQLKFLGFAGANIDAGGDPNSNGENRNAGAVNLNEDLPAPAKISGLVSVNGQMDAPRTGVEELGLGSAAPFFCIASGFVDFQGGIPLTAPGVALLFLSTVGLLFNARPARTWGGA